MNEKSNPMPMMYKTIPAVAELNKVPGFDPLKFLRHKVSRKTNEEMRYIRLDMNSRLPPPIRRYGAQRSVAQRVRMTWKCWGVCSWTTMNICRKITEVVRWLHLMWWNWTAKANAHTSM